MQTKQYNGQTVNAYFIGDSITADFPSLSYNDGFGNLIASAKGWTGSGNTLGTPGMMMSAAVAGDVHPSFQDHFDQIPQYTPNAIINWAFSTNDALQGKTVENLLDGYSAAITNAVGKGWPTTSMYFINNYYGISTPAYTFDVNLRDQMATAMATTLATQYNIPVSHFVNCKQVLQTSIICF